MISRRRFLETLAAAALAATSRWMPIRPPFLDGPFSTDQFRVGQTTWIPRPGSFVVEVAEGASFRPGDLVFSDEHGRAVKRAGIPVPFAVVTAVDAKRGVIAFSQRPEVS